MIERPGVRRPGPQSAGTLRAMASTELHRVARGESSANEDLRSCAEEILYLLGVHGVDILFLNPGTDSAPLQEAGVALTERGVAIPRIIVCTFEGVALAAAHGHWQASRRLQAVFVHVDVGTQNLGALVHNVLRDRGGGVVLAGKTLTPRTPTRPARAIVSSIGSRTSPTRPALSAPMPSGPGS